MNDRILSRSSFLIFFSLMALGLFLSFKEEFFLWFADPDTAIMPLVIQGIHQDGLNFIHKFNFPLDNWIFSLILPDSLFFHVFGPGETQILLTGLFIFWGTALCTGLLVSWLAGWKRGACAAALVLLAPQMALGKGGFLAYPVAHNVSVLWGLCALLSCVIWLKRRMISALLGAIVLFFLSSFSDPWLLPAFVLPVLCASGILWYGAPRQASKAYMGLAGAALCILVLCKTHLFGLLPVEDKNLKNFTRLRFSLRAIPNMIASLSFYFNFVPFINFNRIYYIYSTSNVKKIAHVILAIVVNFSLLSYAFCKIISLIRKKWSSINNQDRFIYVFILFSIMGVVSSSFILGNMRHMESSRYLANVYYCVIILATLLPYETMPPTLKRVIYALGIFWGLSSLASHRDLWNEKAIAAHCGTTDVLSILKGHHIHYAYGTYWGVNAHTLTLESGGDYRVRPLLYQQGYHGFLPGIWTSPSWYHVPHNQKWAFILTTHADDDSICPPYPSCREAIIHQFGTPLTIENASRFTFLIYNGTNMHLPENATVDDPPAPLPLQTGHLPRWQDFYPNNELNGSNLVTVDGWGEAKENRIKTRAKQAHITLPAITAGPGLAKMWIHLSSSTTTPRDVDVLYKGKVVARWNLGNDEAIQYLELPVENGQRSLDYAFSILNPETGRHGDLLGVTLYRVQLITADGTF